MRKYRVKKSTNIWTDDIVYYPEEKSMFLWWRIGDEYPIFFKTEEMAWKFIERNYGYSRN
jgi:hypothetical protein